MEFSLLNDLGSESVLGVLLAALWKSSSLVVLTALVVSLLPRASASLRSWLWTLCLLALLAIPIVELMPAWRLSLLPAVGAVSPQLEIVGERGQPERGPLPSQPRERVESNFSGNSERSFLGQKTVADWLPGALLLTWLTGGMAILVGWLFSWHSSRRLIRDGSAPPQQTRQLVDSMAVSAGFSVPPRVLMTTRLQSPAVAGLLRPVVLLPQPTLEWTRERLSLVIRHELEHISRYDSLLQLAARVSCSIYWFNPLVWKADLAMHREREKACDDAVLSTGVRPSLYAQSLLDVARMLRGRRKPLGRVLLVATIPMAGPSNLEERLMAILDVTRTRKFLSQRVRLASLLLAVAVLTVLGAVEFQLRAAAPSQSSIATAETAVTPSVASLPAGSAAPASQFQQPPRSGLSRDARRNSRDRRVTSYSRREDDGSLEMIWRDGDRRLEVEAVGNIELSNDDSTITLVSPGGYLRIREVTRGEGAIEFEVTSDSSNRLDFRFAVDSRVQPFEREGRQWLGRVLLEVVRRSGLAASQRVERLLGQGGPNAVFGEIDQIESDGVKVIYFRRLMDSAELSDSQWADFFALASRQISSDGDKSRLLIHALAPVSDRDISVHKSWLAATRTISSDGDKSRALIASMDEIDPNGGIAPEAYQTIRSISSDGDKARVLLRWVDRGDEIPLGETFYDVASTISSDGDLSRVLLAALTASSRRQDAVQSIQLLEAARSIDSDGDLARVLIRALRLELNDQALHELLDTARSIGSDGDKARVLLAMAGQFELNGSLRRAFLEVADSIRSDGDQRRVMRGIQP